MRITIGKKEMDQGVVELYRRDTGDKQLISIDRICQAVVETLYDIQRSLLAKNIQFRESNTVSADTYKDFKQALEEGKFVLAHRDGTAETEAKIKEECKAVTRCIPFDSPLED